MTKTTKNLILVPITVVLFSLLLSNMKVMAYNWNTIDVNTPDSRWVADGTEGSFKKTVTLYVGDTFTNISDSGLEGDLEHPPSFLLDYGNIITDKGNNTFKVTATGIATKTYIGDRTKSWTKKTIYIIAKEKEVKGLTVSTKSVSLTTVQNKKLEATIKALSGYRGVKISNSNSKVVKITKLPDSPMEEGSIETIYSYRLTPLKAGTTTITVSSKFDPTITQTIKVTVKDAYYKKPTNYVYSKNGKYSYSAMKSDLLSLTKYHQSTKPVKLVKIGTSLDKRNIYSLRIGNPNAKKRVFVVAGLHGREYMNPYFVMDNIEEMLNQYDSAYTGNSYTYRELYDKVCLYVIPMSNPDGISIAQQGAKAIQNKTLREYVVNMQKRIKIPYSRWKGNAKNVNLNRNFPVGWEKLTTYRKEGNSGKKPASEPETKCLMDYVNKIKPSAVINYHSMGEVIYWGFYIDKSSTSYKQSVALRNISTGLTGYRAGAPHKSKRETLGCFEHWLSYTKKIPTLCIETGNVACPLPMSQYNRLYQKNKQVIEKICNYYR